MATQDSSSRQAELQADIERQREQLAATVNELTEQVQVRAKTTAKQAAVVAGVATVLVVVIVVVKRRRS
jgi:Protein of unknown function (DUF3618)